MHRWSSFIVNGALQDSCMYACTGFVLACENNNRTRKYTKHRVVDVSTDGSMWFIRKKRAGIIRTTRDNTWTILR